MNKWIKLCFLILGGGNNIQTVQHEGRILCPDAG